MNASYCSRVNGQLRYAPLVAVAVVHRLLAVARRAEHDRIVDRVARDDRRDRVVERQRLDAEPRANRLGERVGRERPGGDDARDSEAP